MSEDNRRRRLARLLVRLGLDEVPGYSTTKALVAYARDEAARSYIEQAEELERRLTEEAKRTQLLYDVIADQRREIDRLRAENAALKRRLGEASP